MAKSIYPDILERYKLFLGGEIKGDNLIFKSEGSDISGFATKVVKKIRAESNK